MKRLQRIESRARLEDVVLPPAQLRKLREIAAAASGGPAGQADGRTGGRTGRIARGTCALFVGAAGTGKTLAAEALANELRLPLYRVDLARVLSKYIGETEKNLEGVFDAAAESGATLFFDEADALFGKRSEVRDSHDRYANLDTSYLLEQIEEFEGLTILAANSKSNIDPAFVRRLRYVVTFPRRGKAGVKAK